jgi:hypothetical protein
MGVQGYIDLFAAAAGVFKAAGRESYCGEH